MALDSPTVTTRPRPGTAGPVTTVTSSPSDTGPDGRAFFWYSSTGGAIGNTSGCAAPMAPPVTTYTHQPYRQYFSTLQLCMAAAPRGSFLYARDVIGQQKMYFFQSSPILRGSAHQSEYVIIGSGAVYFFADIDVSPPSPDSSYTSMRDESMRRLHRVMASLPPSARSTVYECHRPSKFGFHVHADVVFPSVAALAAFVSAQSLHHVVDMLVYSPLRCFRIPYAPKGEPAVAPPYLPWRDATSLEEGIWCHPTITPMYSAILQVSARRPPPLVCTRVYMSALALQHARSIYEFMTTTSTVRSPWADTETFSLQHWQGHVLLICDHCWCPQLQRDHHSTRTRIFMTAHRVCTVCFSNDACKSVSCRWPQSLSAAKSFFFAPAQL